LNRNKRFYLSHDWKKNRELFDKTPVDLYSSFYSQARLRAYFDKLSYYGIEDLEDLKKYTLDDLEKICPMDNKTRTVFMLFIKNGILILKGQSLESNLGLSVG
tara:strand:- start:1495 stop:1803 length:309 start_codon:yes stop_codon:yes gene_type:complete